MQQYQQPDPGRMTDTEAQEVLQLLAERRQRHEDAQALPTVQDVAVLASANPEDVEAALSEVRARHYAASYATPVEAKRRTPFPVLVALVSAVILAVVLFLFAGSAQISAPVTVESRTLAKEYPATEGIVEVPKKAASSMSAGSPR